MTAQVHRAERLCDGERVVSIRAAGGGAAVRIDFTEAEGPQPALSALSRLVIDVLVAAREVQGLHRPRTLAEVFAEEEARGVTY